MDRSKLAKLAALAIAYQNVGKPKATAFFMGLYLAELGISPRDIQNGECPMKYADMYGAKIVQE